MDSKTKIIISRSSEWMNRLRTYKVFINGKQAGTVKNGVSEEFAVEPGVNSVQCKVDWYSSQPFNVDVKEGETNYLRVKSGIKYYWLFMVAIIVGVFIMFSYKGKSRQATMGYAGNADTSYTWRSLFIVLYHSWEKKFFAGGQRYKECVCMNAFLKSIAKKVKQSTTHLHN